MAHIFISYAHSDTDAVDRLTGRLSDASYDIWIDREDIRAGDQWRRQIVEAVKACDVFIITLSPNSVRSDNVRRELDLAGRAQKTIIPLLIAEVEIPDEMDYQLVGLQRVNLVDDYEAGFKKLLEALEPVTDRDRPKAAAKRLPSAALFRVPFRRNKSFVGREHDLDRLHQALQGEGPTGITGLTGMGGIGKTQLAVEYVYAHRNDYPGGTFWINAAEPLHEGLARLATYLWPETIESTQTTQLQAIERYLREHGDALLILDNLADPAELDRLLDGTFALSALPCRLLFTTRRRDLGDFEPVELTILPPAAALELLLRHPERQPILEEGHPQYGSARRICRILGYLPLALEVSAAQVGGRPKVPLDKYEDELLARGALPVIGDPRAGLSPADLPTRHEVALAATLESQWESLPSEEARLLLRTAGQLPEAALIPTARLGLLACLPEEAESFFDVSRDQALQQLADASLVEDLLEEQLRLHPLVREFASARTPAGETPSFRATLAVNLAAAYGDFAILEANCAARGIDALQEDILVALDLQSNKQQPYNGDEPSAASDQSPATSDRQPATDDLPPAPDPQSLHPDLLRLLQRESHNLRGWDSRKAPVFFAQQLHNRARSMELARLEQATKKQLAGRIEPRLDLLWRAGSESTALERTLVGHDGTVTAVALTPDGKRAVSTSSDQTLKIWELDSGRLLRTLEGHEDWVRAVALTPDGKRAVSASEDSTLNIWELNSGRLLRILEGHGDALRAVALTPDGKRAVSTSNDRTLRIWELNSGRLLRTLEGHEDLVLAVALTPDGKRAVSASADNTLKIWELDSGRLLRTVEGHRDAVRTVALTPSGKRIVSASSDRTLKFWELDSGRLLRTLKGHESRVRAVALTPDGKRAVSASNDRTLKIWQLDSGRLLHTLEGHESRVRAVALTPVLR